jgi:sterol desaturase/sphingolipid hydroxylase (fatty acid hydroxylase superfamily)
MEKYFQIFINDYQSYAQYFWHEVTTPHWGNYFYWLIGISLAAWALEIAFPWRKNQPILRKDFWIDGFYMFFNFFFFSLIAYNALSSVVVTLFNDLLRGVLGIENLVAVRVHALPVWAQMLILFVLRDFVQWNVHRLLHNVSWLWEFHKVHHSVEEMGFAAHLRYHWAETIVYRSIEYLPLAMIGYGITDFMWVHLIALSIGHLNHANFNLPLGKLRYIFNSPQMHIWHHAHDMPASHPNGINFAISLSIWDYLFGTAYIPHDGRDIRLGFPDIGRFPRSFFRQFIYPFKK